MTSGRPVQRAKCICDGVGGEGGAKIARALFSFFLFLSFFLSFFSPSLPPSKEKRTLKRASTVFGTDGLKGNILNAEEIDGTRCTNRLIIPIIISETSKGT